MRFLAFLVLITVVLVILFFVGKTRIPDMLANNLSKKLGVAVSIDSMGFSPTKITVLKLEIGNAQGYSLPKAFSAQEIIIHASLLNYFRENVEIELIEVNNIYLGIEFDSIKGTDGNWTKIFSDYEKKAHLGEEGPNARKEFIHKIIFNDLQTDLAFRDQGGSARKLPFIKQIVLTNINTEGGFPTDQLMASILGQMLREVFVEQHLQNMLQGIIKMPGNAIDSFIKPFKGIFNAIYKEEIDQKQAG